VLALAGLAGCRPARPGAHYAHLFGERYRTAVDLRLFHLAGDAERRFLGRPGTLSGLEEVTVLDLVPAGSELVIVAETHEVTPQSGIRDQGGYPMGFICALTYGGKREEGVLAEFIQAGQPAAPGVPNQRIDERIAAVPIALTATRVGPLDIELRWKDSAATEAGYFVEGYFLGPEDSTPREFVLVDVLPPDTTRYRHGRLLPETRFFYRVRPFFGAPSNVAEIATGREGPQSTLAERRASAPTRAGEGPSLRSAAAARAAPSDLQATLIPPAGVRLDWRDHAGDEDEYLVEVRQEGTADFEASAFLERDATSLTTYDFPFESRVAFRVRALVYGPPSNVAEQTTGRE
jgi:hypothetical protein